MKKLLFALMFVTTAAFAQQTPIPLYPDGVPNSKPTPSTYKEYYGSDSFLFKVSVPTITPFFADKEKANDPYPVRIDAQLCGLFSHHLHRALRIL